MSMDKEKLMSELAKTIDKVPEQALIKLCAVNLLRQVIALVEIRESLDALKSELAYLRESLGDYAIARRED